MAMLPLLGAAPTGRSRGRRPGSSPCSGTSGQSPVHLEGNRTAPRVARARARPASRCGRFRQRVGRLVRRARQLQIGRHMRALVLLALVTAPLSAQQASPYVPLQHWAMPYVEQLIASGVLTDPTPLTRPLRQADLVQSLEAIDTFTVNDASFATVRLLLHEFRPRVQGPRYRVDANAGIAAATCVLRSRTCCRSHFNPGRRSRTPSAQPTCTSWRWATICWAFRTHRRSTLSSPWVGP